MWKGFDQPKMRASPKRKLFSMRGLNKFKSYIKVKALPKVQNQAKTSFVLNDEENLCIQTIFLWLIA